ncbi:MAG: glycosyltransferase family 2 protein [Candidatus Binatia bacterium]
MIKASVVILTWNSTDVLGPCLTALPAGFTTSAYEVIVVDNGSRGYTPAALRNEFPTMRLVVNRKNRGVAPARNQGMRVAQGEYIILLDDDTVVLPGAFDCLIAYLDQHPQVSLCGPKLVDPQGRLQLSCRLFPTVGDKLARRFPFAFARQRDRQVEMADWDHATVREVDYVIGACQVIRRAALVEVGLLDEKIFYGPEDVDLCLRMRAAGWRVMYNPEAVVMHRERRVARSPLSRLGWRHLGGLVHYFWKHGYVFSRHRLYKRLGKQPSVISQKEGAES